MESTCVNGYGENVLLQYFMRTENPSDGIVRKMLQEEGHSPNGSYTPNSPLAVAIVLDSLSLVQLLVENGASLEKRGYHGNTPLHDAVIAGNPAIVAYLLERGANVNAQNNFGDTPLYLSLGGRAMGLIRDYQYVYYCRSTKERYTIIQALLSAGADPSLYTKEGWTSLRAAILYHKKDWNLLTCLTDKMVRLDDLYCTPKEGVSISEIDFPLVSLLEAYKSLSVV